MDVTTVRHNNLILLVEEIRRAQQGRLQKHIAADLGLSPSYLAQLMKGKKMGDEVARKIEQERGLAHGWMDHQAWPVSTGEAPPPDYLSQSVRTDASTLAVAIALARMSLENLEEDFKPESESDAQIVLMASNYLLARNERAVTAENVVGFTKILRQRRRQGAACEETTGTAGTRVTNDGPR